MEHMEESDAYISMKYYKETFPPKPARRLFNPSNSEIGKATKARVNLININQKILENIQSKQWKNTTSVRPDAPLSYSIL